MRYFLCSQAASPINFGLVWLSAPDRVILNEEEFKRFCPEDVYCWAFRGPTLLPKCWTNTEFGDLIEIYQIGPGLAGGLLDGSLDYAAVLLDVEQHVRSLLPEIRSLAYVVG